MKKLFYHLQLLIPFLVMFASAFVGGYSYRAQQEKENKEVLLSILKENINTEADCQIVSMYMCGNCHEGYRK